MLNAKFRMLVTQIYWRCRLGSLGRGSILYKPLLVTNPERIRIGAFTQIRDLARIEVVHRPSLGWDAQLTIGNRVLIEQGAHIVCQGEVEIGDDVAITAYCAIVDTYHPHDPPDREPAIGRRLPDRKTYVKIGSGSFIGMHSTILPNVTIGRGCVIGANSVVRSDIPDYCVAVGAPARVVSRFDTQNRSWSRVHEVANASSAKDP